MGMKSALLLLLQWLSPTVPAGNSWDAFPTLGVEAGVTSGVPWEGPGSVGLGNAESATETPEKAIPAGALSIKCRGWVKEAKLLLNSWPREKFPG